MKQMLAIFISLIIMGITSAQTPEYMELWNLRKSAFSEDHSSDTLYMMLNKMDSLYNGNPYFDDLIYFLEIALQCNQFEKAKEIAFRLVRWKCWDTRIFDHSGLDILKTMDYWPALDSLSQIYGNKSKYDEYIYWVDEMAITDQHVRAALRKAQTQTEKDSLRQVVHQVDSINLNTLKKLISKYGFPTWEKLGIRYARRAWIIAQHADPEFLHMYMEQMKNAVINDDEDISSLAFMIDRDLVNRKLPQLYGTQGYAYFTNDNKMESGLWPIDDLEHLNDRREHMLLEPIDTTTVKIFDKEYILK